MTQSSRVMFACRRGLLWFVSHFSFVFFWISEAGSSGFAVPRTALFLVKGMPSSVVPFICVGCDMRSVNNLAA